VVVPVDILPRRCPNRFLKLRTARTVAILGSADLDALEIDPASILVAGLAPVGGHALKDVATLFEPFVGKNDAFDCTSEGPDGFDDLVVPFDVEAVLDRLGPVSHGDVITMPVSAELFDGTPVRGEDVVLIVQRKLDDDDDDDDDDN
jgi:hypothetical protein